MQTRDLLSRMGIAALGAAALFTGGCGGGSNSLTTYQVTPSSTFPTEYLYANDIGVHDLLAYKLSSTGESSNPVSITALSTTSNYAEAIAIDSAHQYLFVVNNEDGDQLQVYKINADGSLSQSTVTATGIDGNTSGNNQEITVVSPPGSPANTEYVYIAGAAAGQMSAFSFNEGTGVLTPFAPGTSQSDSPYTLASNTVSGTSYLYSGGTAGNPDVNTYTINAATGTLTLVGPQIEGTEGPVLVAAAPSEADFYSYDQGIDELYSTSVSGSTLTNGPRYSTAPNVGLEITVAPNDSAVYLSNGTAGTITRAAIGSGGNLSTPTYTAVVSGSDLIGIAVDSTSSYVLTLDNDTSENVGVRAHVYSPSNTVLIYTVSAGGLSTPISITLPGANDPVAAIFVSTIGQATV